jgi:hypothetical protein
VRSTGHAEADFHVGGQPPLLYNTKDKKRGAAPVKEGSLAAGSDADARWPPRRQDCPSCGCGGRRLIRRPPGPDALLRGSSKLTFLRRLAMQVAETWDSCIENTIRKLAYGTLAGGLAAMILFRE